ncbi:aldehyde dehydrogenase family protein (plasmid) [Ruegeria pomeroyi DSS-3]|uniref:Aldehyde dehydrogenase family protein n=2 Tax=Ruegeria pomeroyi TaxID=89184 RepID=Q5LKW9_RUEPO|nr:aldehyde dehydrogenase (NADP(+)) [Ruegeria pomeroyi]AAV97394.1 aldehyde dehydrogenase family protein [Ruegeria pomeroyi DSS-3]NVK97029.1 aldehyde dehydrogenase (NADP(+)) [Ruegeria pomeroyi]NVL02232.1 aldehyde dehydrogenase (NADP(+)) [Ruegeria pomeroyi]HCE71669.1 aldehyde dehydrogenase (NADP(+)) [Ruegeria sp.]
MFKPHGRHLIAGKWVDGDDSFSSEPAHGPSHRFAVGRVADVDAAATAAENAFWSFASSTRAARADLLTAIADEIDACGGAITEIGTQESGLPEARLIGERGRTTGQLRLFATHILKGDYLDRRHDAALPDRQPLPRPDLRMIQRPIGPVAVFGASNFPLAFSTAGGDTAAALAAGCPVVVKAHGAHPGTSEIVAEAVKAAIERCGFHPGVFGLIQGGNRQVGAALVQHPLIKAVGFTGSLGGGRALFDLCAARPEPIPFFGELGSVNPMFIFAGALANRGSAIAQGWAGSLTMGAGQFCTNPGVAVMLAGPNADAFAQSAAEALAQVAPQTMLTDGIAEAYRAGQRRMGAATGVRELLSTPCDQRSAAPSLYATTAKAWLANEELAEEVFGPLGMIVTADSVEEMLAIARDLQGQLTCTVHVDAEDAAAATRFMPVLERKAGRILANGFPTGVEVSDTMVHGGPYPASTNFGATSVGTLSIRRFLRPVCYQDMPEGLLPADL